MIEKQYITMREAAQMLGVSYSKMQREAARKDCPRLRRTPRSPIFFSPEKLRAWWEKSSV